MTAIVIYDTKFGTTQKVAEAIAQILNADLLKASDVDVKKLNDYDAMVFGCPTQIWNISGGMRDLFKRMQGKSFTGKTAVAFDTKINSRFAGSAAKKIEGKLRKLGFTLAMSAVSFFVTGQEGPLADGELDKTQAFATL
ncbi:MAG: flavodoxin family protein [Candidatus Ranarchaeia archaeon]